MFNRKIIVIILIIVVVVVAAGIFLLTKKKPNDFYVINTNLDNTNLNTNINQLSNQTPTSTLVIPQVSEEDKLKAQLERLSTSFVERYGSYSNQSDFENLEDLLPFMSQSFSQWAEDFVSLQRANRQESAIYYGLTTRALNSETIEFAPENGLIKVKVSTQRQEVVGSAVNSKVYYQDAEVELIKENDIWKVSRITWL